MRHARALLVAAMPAILAGALPLAAAQGKTYRLAVISISAASIELTAARALPMLAKASFPVLVRASEVIE